MVSLKDVMYMQITKEPGIKGTIRQIEKHCERTKKKKKK